LLPELDLRRLFPDCSCSPDRSYNQLELFAEYWDDGESDRTNVEAITWWLNQVDPTAQDAGSSSSPAAD
jgi:hypothetical protein